MLIIIRKLLYPSGVDTWHLILFFVAPSPTPSPFTMESAFMQASCRTKYLLKKKSICRLFTENLLKSMTSQRAEGFRGGVGLPLSLLIEQMILSP